MEELVPKNVMIHLGTLQNHTHETDGETSVTHPRIHMRTCQGFGFYVFLEASVKIHCGLA